MFITEQDIFLYINFPEQLTEEKRQHIRNTPEFKDAIEYFTAMKAGTGAELVEGTENLADEILNEEGVVLELMPELTFIRPEKLNFAAQDSSPVHQITAKSYSCGNKNVLVRIVRSGVDFRVFTFLKEDEPVHLYSMRLFTDNGVYIISKIQPEVMLKLPDFPSKVDLLLTKQE